MPVEVVVPNLGEGGMELAFAGWLRQEGERVRAGEDIFEIDTDKVTVSVQAFQEGILTGLRVQAGDIVERGQVIATLMLETEIPVQLTESAGAGTGSAGESPEATAPPASSEMPAPGKASDPQVPPDGGHGGKRPATPRAKRAAQRLGVVLDAVEPLRPDGLVTETDVERAYRVSSGPRRVRARKSLADLTVRSWQSVPHLYLRHDLNLSGIQLPVSGLLGLVTTLLVAALASDAGLNLELQDSGPVGRASIDIGVLVTTESGTVLPRLTGCQAMASQQIAHSVSDLTARTRNGLLRPEDYGPRSATIYDMSAWPVECAHGVIPAPDPMLVTIAQPTTVPRWSDGTWVPIKSVSIGLALDHRVFSAVDGGRLFQHFDALLTARRTLPEQGWCL